MYRVISVFLKTFLEFLLFCIYMSDQPILTGTLIDGEISSDDQSSNAGQQPLITPA
jgi:hypothetical protein